MSKHKSILRAAVIAFLAMVSLWSYWQMATAKTTCMLAHKDLVTCNDLVERIQNLQIQPTKVAGEERQSSETTGLIERAARSAGMSSQNLVSITPAPPKRIEKSAYRKKNTQVSLRDITLKQLADYLYILSTSPQPLHPESVRISTKSNQDAGNLWQVELDLNYLIYDPPKTSKKE